MILTSGAFDGIHAGHVRYLDAAKQLCNDVDELLICAVASDDYIANAKGHRPRWSHADRIIAVHGLSSVDAVIPHGWPSVASLIRQYRPRLFVKGVDWGTSLPEDVLAACEEGGTDVAFVDSGVTGHSSDDLSSQRS